jgi:hypothetical protein
MQIYAGDFDGHLPLAAAWHASINPYLEKAGSKEAPAVRLVCPGPGSHVAFGLNSAAAGRSVWKADQLPKAVVFFESQSNKVGFVGNSDALALKHHSGRPGIGYADGTIDRQRAGASWEWR